MSSTTSRWISRSWSKASASCVKLTLPSIEFSIGTKPSSITPLDTASSTSGTLGNGISSRSARSTCERSAWSVNDPNGPNNPMVEWVEESRDGGLMGQEATRGIC